jgi:hypothetical protein
VAFVSDNGEEHGLFAIVEVRGIHAPLIVPADCIRAGEPRVVEPGLSADLGFRLEDSHLPHSDTDPR